MLKTVTKTITVCPFSKLECRECAIYRGRHVEMCSAARHRSNGASADRRKEVQSCAVFTHWDFPEIPDSPNIMVNIEDFIDRSGL
ncbi:MAG: hypothetical protein ABSC19_06080 [Syntrophorhabdales bacterium]